MAQETVCVREVNGEADAQQIRSFLAAHDVPSFFDGEALRVVHGFTLDGLGVVRIQVRAEDAEKARSLLEQADRGELALSEDSTPEIE